ncbi:MAG TPA: glycine-rich protein, partial [Chitinophagales bacterium]|nr:glycine-rich protein [Chitinophagales bacterium]
MKYISLYKHTYLTLIFILITILVNGQSNKTDSVLFEFTGTTKTWTVPTGVTSLWVDAMGAEGGGRQAGKGGRVQCLLPVKPGDKLTITVGGQATNDAGGYNGGGTGCGKGFGGGGATDIRLNGNDLDARIVVAGGGGGIGYGGYGGAGGGLTGGNGAYDTTTYHFAKGGTQTEGGAGARAYYSEAGQKGTGGKGLDSRGNCTNNAMGG